MSLHTSFFSKFSQALVNSAAAPQFDAPVEKGNIVKKNRLNIRNKYYFYYNY